MRLNTSLKNIFEEKEIEKLQRALARDNIIVKAFIKVLEHRLENSLKPTSLEDLDNSAWPLQRAFRDGKASEDMYLLKLFSEE